MGNNNKRIIIASITIMLLTIIGLTYAFFIQQGNMLFSNDAIVTSNTTDLLTFEIDDDIEFEVSQFDFAENGNNKSGSTDARAILTPNNKTGEATEYYYMYLNITENGIDYSSSNTNQDPELMVQLFDGNNQLVLCPSLGEQVTVKGVTGYDITGITGALALLNNKEISASNNQQTIQNWRVVVTLINHDFNQNDNAGKTVDANLILRKDSMRRVTDVVPQECENGECGKVEALIIPDKDTNEEEIFAIYTVGYLNSDANGTTYSLDIRNLGVDLSLYSLELDGSPQVMTTQTDFYNYLTMKNGGVPIATLVNGSDKSAVATAEEMYTYSLNATELTINSVDISCNMIRCIATISESFSNISNKPRHSTTTNDNEAINVLYNGIKFNLKKRRLNNVEMLLQKYGLSNPGNITLDNGMIYYHNSSLANGANDNSYRYAGANPNNFVCFGSNAATCPADNLYRIIGLIPVDVVVDSTTNPETTERQILYKLIKYEYADASNLNMQSTGNAAKFSLTNVPNEDQPTGNISGYHWVGSGTESNNTWSLSDLNYYGLNNAFINSFDGYWSNKIANVMWSVGGKNWYYVSNETASNIYNNEVVNPTCDQCSDNKIKLANKVGLMYVSDYGFSALQSAWTRKMENPSNPNLSYSNQTIAKNNWIYRGVLEWTITRQGGITDNAICINSNGQTGGCGVSPIGGDIEGTFVEYDSSLGVRPAFYLTSDTYIDMSNYAGTKKDPYRIGNVQDENSITESEISTRLALFSNNSKYTIKEYIESNGNQFIDTKHVSNQDTRVVIRAQVPTGNSINTGYRLFGSRTSARNNGFFISSLNNNYYLNYGNQEYQTNIVVDNNIHEYDFNKNRFYFDGNLVKEFSYEVFKVKENAILFGGNQTGSIVAKPWRIYYTKIYNDSNLVRYLIPCVRNSDNVVGMYDLVNDKFYTNAKSEVNTENTLFITLYNRNFYKRYADPAYAGYYVIPASVSGRTNDWTYHLLVGTTPDSVVFYTSYNYVTCTSVESLTYKGKTYYVSSTSYSMEGNYSDTSGNNLKKYNIATTPQNVSYNVYAALLLLEDALGNGNFTTNSE